LADDVIAFDDDVDRQYLRIEEGIQSLLARQTPVATDLRLVLAMLHTNLHLERMADYSVTIAKLTKLVADVEGDPTMLQTLQEMGERAEEMISVALDSFANRDLEAAETTRRLSGPAAHWSRRSSRSGLPTTSSGPGSRSLTARSARAVGSHRSPPARSTSARATRR